MDEEKLSSLIVNKMCDRLGDSLIKVSLLCGIASFSLFLYGKYVYIEKGLKTDKQ